MRSIRLFVTGGTIDNLDYIEEERAPTGGQSVIPALLRQSRCTAPVSIETLFLKDGRFVTEQERDFLVQRCSAATEEGIVVTHGTTTVALTAAALGPRVRGKTVVLTGAMTMPKEADSDAHFNLGYALAVAQHLPPGVYVAMNGQVFAWDRVRKNQEEGIFESS